ncbi:uncharacterized protein LOC121386066 isoform X2 [Gigantopelta aegis]|uniref:uncharacterized protein LOC121386066 isoform X2 n=1 Tax=Gigantopelta aegis TaxID=1735272 RepID=UPI001B8882C0|nr:uncharacterized protein LOC121386066 isoform X2 [Gigantopelta aegis]
MDNGLRYLAYHSSDMQGGDGLYSRMSMSGQQLFEDTIDPDLEHKTRRVADKFSENINAIANEPSLAFFRIQEHVRKTLPQLVEQKHEVQEIQQKVQGACFDTEYATNAVKTMHQSTVHFQNIQDLLKNAMFMKQQIGYEELRSTRALAASHPSSLSSTAPSIQADSDLPKPVSLSSTVPSIQADSDLPRPVSLSSTAPSIQADSDLPRPVSGGDDHIGADGVEPNVDDALELTEETLAVLELPEETFSS